MFSRVFKSIKKTLPAQKVKEDICDLIFSYVVQSLGYRGFQFFAGCFKLCGAFCIPMEYENMRGKKSLVYKISKISDPPTDLLVLWLP